MLTLKPDECRVLGVLIEKALTTPQQYPLSLNALTVGCNQKNCRLPVTDFDEERVFDAVESLRAKGLVREAMLSGSRVAKFRHVAREVLEVETPALVVLAELLLRGPQTAGELRGNASRMHPIESLEALQGVLATLVQRDPPMVRELPGGHARRFAQLLCPDLHPLDERVVHAPASASSPLASGNRAAPAAGPDVSARLDALEREVAKLRDALQRIAIDTGTPVNL
ncbi:MAG: DUF480 domain-containing protein [Phycisphaeraceae bacterium]|nr:DUF480 domain-containing protein [Phycisphaeraceae bacterium]